MQNSERIRANAAGNSERYATSMPAAKIAPAVGSPPNVVIVATSQYSVPEK